MPQILTILNTLVLVYARKRVRRTEAIAATAHKHAAQIPVVKARVDKNTAQVNENAERLNGIIEYLDTNGSSELPPYLS